MSIYPLDPDSALGVLVFSHRHGWNGTVCAKAASWNCGSAQEFRDEHCALGRERCHVIHAFDRGKPYLRLNYDVLQWVLGDDIERLNGRTMLVWAKSARGDYGIGPGQPSFRMAGAYRINRVVKSGVGYKYSWEVYPSGNQWCRFAELNITPPTFTETSSPLCKIIAGDTLLSHFKRIEDRFAENPEILPQEADRTALQAFMKALPEWQDELAKKAVVSRPRAVPLSSPFSGLPNGLGKLSVSPPKPPAMPSRSVPAPAEAVAPPAPPPTQIKIPEPPAAVQDPVAEVSAAPTPAAAPVPAECGFLESASLHANIERRHGAPVLRALQCAASSQKIIILRGLTGAGKSHLARQVLPDPAMERTFILPVSATWRGSEDLLGFTNPIDRKFQPTPFTQFLQATHAAWESGDQRHRVVIFEEFNLSQPEYWLTDLLVRLEYPAEDRNARSLVLGAGDSPDQSSRVYLPPNLRFVATMNNDHTTRPLSPRVLDRAAVIELRVSPEVALESHQVTLSSQELQAVRDLNFALRIKGVCFSHRTAMSLSAALGKYAQNGDNWPFIDAVLAVEILSKVRLQSANPSDETVLSNLGKWADDYGDTLPECVRMIRSWGELIEAGQDIVQA